MREKYFDLFSSWLKVESIPTLHSFSLKRSTDRQLAANRERAAAHNHAIERKLPIWTASRHLNIADDRLAVFSIEATEFNLTACKRKFLVALVFTARFLTIFASVLIAVRQKNGENWLRKHAALNGEQENGRWIVFLAEREAQNALKALVCASGLRVCFQPDRKM